MFMKQEEGFGRRHGCGSTRKHCNMRRHKVDVLFMAPTSSEWSGPSVRRMEAGRCCSDIRCGPRAYLDSGCVSPLVSIASCSCHVLLQTFHVIHRLSLYDFLLATVRFCPFRFVHPTHATRNADTRVRRAHRHPRPDICPFPSHTMVRVCVSCPTV